MDPQRLKQADFDALKRRAIELCGHPRGNVDLGSLTTWVMDLTNLTAKLYIECEQLRQQLDERG